MTDRPTAPTDLMSALHKVALLLLVWSILLAGVLYVVFRGYNDRNDDLERVTCEIASTHRDVLQQLVVAATEGGGSDLTTVPGFDALDPELQQFLHNLADATTSSQRQADLRERLLATIPDLEC